MLSTKPSPRHNVTAFRILLFAVSVIILYLASTDQPIEAVDDLDDKFSHILAFGTLAFLVDFSWPDDRFGLAKTSGLLVFGIFIELVQHFLPYREAALLDVIADAAGIMAYLLSIPLLRHVPWIRQRWD